MIISLAKLHDSYIDVHKSKENKEPSCTTVFDIPSGVLLDERIVIVMAEIVFNWYELISV